MIIRTIIILLTLAITCLATLGAFALGGSVVMVALAATFCAFGVTFALIRVAFVAGPIAVAGGVIVAMGMAALITTTLAYGMWNRDAIANRLLDATMRARMPNVFDASGTWIGAYPAATFADYNEDPDLPGRMSIASSGKPPKFFSACTIFLEDRAPFEDGLIASFGVDFRGLIRSFVTQHGGGSKLIQMFVRALHHISPGKKETFVDRWRRKIIEWAGSPATVSLIRAPDIDPLAFITDNLQFVIGYKSARAGELPAGLEYISRTVFNRAPDRLSPEQQLVVSAAIWLPVLIAPESDAAGIAAVDGRWSKLIRRASRCAGIVAQEQNVPVEKIVSQLGSLPPPRINSSDLVFEKSATDSLRFKISANPGRRLIHNVGVAGLQVIHDEIQDHVGDDWRGKVNSIQLGTDSDQQSELTASISQAVAGIEARYRNRLHLRMTGPDVGDDRAQVLAVVTDLSGVVRGFYETGAAGAIDQQRQGGSVDKIIGAAILGNHDRPGTAYCNKHIEGLHNAGGNSGAVNCGASGAHIAARDVFARSLTLALINRLAKLPRSEIENAIKILGLEVPKDVPLSTAVASGLVEGSPRTFLRMMIAIGRVISGREGDAHLPHLIKSLESAGLMSPVDDPADKLKWADVKKTFGNSRTFLLDVLGAPLTRGTLSSMSNLHQSRNQNIAWHVSKTGTATVQSGLTRDAMIAGAFETRDGHAYAYFVLVGAPTPKRPLGTLNGSHLSPIAAAIVNNILNRRRVNVGQS